MLDTRFAFRSPLGGAEGLGVVAAVWGGRLFGAQDGAVCGLALRQSNTGQYPAAKATGGRTACGNKKPDGTAQAVPSGEILLCQRKRSPLSGPDSGRKRPG